MELKIESPQNLSKLTQLKIIWKIKKYFRISPSQQALQSQIRERILQPSSREEKRKKGRKEEKNTFLERLSWCHHRRQQTISNSRWHAILLLFRESEKLAPYIPSTRPFPSASPLFATLLDPPILPFFPSRFQGFPQPSLFLSPPCPTPFVPGRLFN